MEADMATVETQYREYLDILHDENPGALFRDYSGARTLEEIDPIAYRVGLADYEPTCEKCGETFCVEDTDGEAVCADCADSAEDDEDS
jgi:hypothetical protein